MFYNFFQLAWGPTPQACCFGDFAPTQQLTALRPGSLRSLTALRGAVSILLHDSNRLAVDEVSLSGHDKLIARGQPLEHDHAIGLARADHELP